MEKLENIKVASIIVNNRPFTSAKQISELLSKKNVKGKIHPAIFLFKELE